jgi:predicted nucleic acid-binding protein
LLFIDTDIAIGMIHGKIDIEIIKEKVATTRKIAITSLSMYELYFGLYLIETRKKGKAKKEEIERERKAIEKLKEICIQVPLDDTSAEKAAMLYHDLANKGQEIAEYDCMIAATVLTQKDGSLLTGNVDHFKRIEGFPLVAFEINFSDEP